MQKPYLIRILNVYTVESLYTKAGMCFFSSEYYFEQNQSK